MITKWKLDVDNSEGNVRKHVIKRLTFCIDFGKGS